MIVLVSGERQTEALHRVADEARRLFGIGVVERLEHRWHVMAAEIVHQCGQLIVTPLLNKLADVALVADFIIQSLAPGRPTREHQRGIKLVGAVVDPAAQRLAAWFLESRLLERAIFQDDDVPAEVLEKLFVARPEALTHYCVKALAIVVDDPPAIAQALLPA